MRLERSILLQLLVGFAFAVAGMLFIALPGVAVAAIHKLPNVSILVLGRYIPLVLQNLAPYVLPIGFLLAVVSTYGRLAADREWIAIQMAGIRPVKMLRPALVLALVLAAFMHWLVAFELPHARKREQQFLLAAARSSIANIAPGQNGLQLGDFSLNGFQDGDVFRDAYIHRAGKSGESGIDVFAKTAGLWLEGDVLFVHMTGVQNLGPGLGGKGDIAELSARIPLKELIEQRKEDYDLPKYLTTLDMLRRLREEELPENRRRRYLFEVHERLSVSLSFVLFLALGAATGLLMRRGTRLGALAVSILYALIYYLFSEQLGKGLGRNQGLPPQVGAWATLGLGMVAGSILLRRALRR